MTVSPEVEPHLTQRSSPEESFYETFYDHPHPHPHQHSHHQQQDKQQQDKQQHMAPSSPCSGGDRIGESNVNTNSRRLATTTSGINHPIHYSFAQAFGERSIDTPQPVVVEESDMISAVSFNFDSDMIATGDKGGRVVILKRVDNNKCNKNNNKNKPMYNNNNTKKRCRPIINNNNNNNKINSHNNKSSSSILDFHNDADFDFDGDQQIYGSGSSAGEEEDDEDEDEDDQSDNDDYDDDYMSNNNNNNNKHTQIPEYKFWTQFQSHESEFDYLKSMEIEEKINQICWCRQAGNTHRLIATNDKTIKVWRIGEKQVKAVVKMDPQSLSHKNSSSSTSSSYSSSSYSSGRSSASSNTKLSPKPNSLQIPKLQVYGDVISATPRRIFSNAHSYHINSISLNSDEVTFLSADDLRIHLWNLEAGGIGFNILDMKPENMENLNEVITSAKFHPYHCNLLAYSSSKGIIKLNDLRKSALCNKPIRKFEQEDLLNNIDIHRFLSATSQHQCERPSFFNEIISSISDVKFSPNGRYILTRDYLNLRLWDMNMENKPLKIIPVHDHLRLRLCDLYENDCIFDKFQCDFSSDGNSLLTGSYNSLFQSYSAVTGLGCAVEASVDYVSGNSNRYQSNLSLDGNMIGNGPIELLDPKKRIMTLDSSPTEQIAAVASGPALYVYYAGATNFHTQNNMIHNGDINNSRW